MRSTGTRLVGTNKAILRAKLTDLRNRVPTQSLLVYFALNQHNVLRLKPQVQESD
jgi:hypothetical protein